MDTHSFDPSVQEKDLVSKVVVGFERIAESFRVLLWEHAKREGISPIQIQLLIFIRYHKRELRSVSYLAKEFNMTKATISDAVKVLAQKKLIEKQTGPNDARSYSISLSASGRKLVESVEMFSEPLQSSVGKLSTKEQTELFNALSKIIGELNRNGIISVQRTCSACKFYKKKEGHHYCNFLNKELATADIRLDCEDFQLKEA